MIFDDADTYDTDSMHDPAGAHPSRMTVNTEGVYLFLATVVFAANAVGVRGLGFRSNGSGVETFYEVPTMPITLQHDISCSVVVPMSAGDYMEAIVYQSSGGALNAGSNDSTTGVFTTFTAARLGAL